MQVWKNSMELAERIFNVTENLPKKEDYGFTSQIRRAALSISANIAESYGRQHTADKINFLFYARGSVTETQNHLEYGKRVGYINNLVSEDLDLVLENIHKELNKIIITLKNNSIS